MKPLFTQSELDAIRRELVRVWNAIGYDIEAACNEAGEPVDNASAIEVCIDCDRLDDSVRETIRREIDRGDFNAVISYLDTNINLA